MKALILDGSLRGDEATMAVGDLLARELQGAECAVERRLLRDLDVAPCRACLGCWTLTPGVCTTDDAARGVARDMVGADLLVLLTPVTFGGYSSTLKKVLDRSIGNISPFFTTIMGETHHPARYDNVARVVTVGVQPVRDHAAQVVFRTLAARNAVNFHAPAAASGVVVSSEGPDAPHAMVEGLLEQVGVGPHGQRRLPSAAESPDAQITLEQLLEVGAGTVEAGTVGPGPSGLRRRPGRALLVVGSPRRRRSTSAVLGDYLAASLRRSGIVIDRMTVREVLEDEGVGRDAFASALDRAELLVLAFPLYVDAVPAPLVALLEWVAARGVRADPAVRVAALVNSGFPEAEQCAPALSVSRRFALETGMSWAGGLALGAGAAIDGRPLDVVGDMACSVCAALDLAAEALAEGRPVTREAVQTMATPMMPADVYRLLGDRGFRSRAKLQGTEEHLGARPYES
jgi:multimeric flavodoxin WrbA